MNKKIVFGVAGLLLLAGGGGGAFYLLERPKSASAAETPAQAAESPSVPVRIPFLAVPIVEASTLRRYAIVSITIEAPSQGDADVVKKDLPRLVDAFLDAFHSDPGGAPVQNEANEDSGLTARLQSALPTLPDAPHIRRIVVSTNHPVPR